MRQHLKSGFRKLERAVTIVNGALLVGITLLIIIQVVARKAGISLAGTEELARFSYVIYTFLAWPIACLYGSNISITMLLDKWKKKVRLMLLVLFQLIMAGFSMVAAYSAFLQMKNQMGVLAPSNDWFHMNWLYAVVFICLLLCALFSLVRAIFLVTGDMVYVTQDEQNEKILEEGKKQFEELEEKEGDK
ncbi:TRAP-type C4-dicarboxylate transport system, small permease component [Oscillibacter sp. PC13]|uniref:TRAP transporter small permease n=1 Tax=Oscillibacter sp. PC13 TaxID=1855299 RepID=UPI0008F233B4|nr:TRAP transporter small permease subunit [Oscillibacter sp. PC13]SFP61861.1 TRAP-type C4-dicarboxylate transport system, small permease component [Oscillibacter sp. PC13]